VKDVEGIAANLLPQPSNNTNQPDALVAQAGNGVLFLEEMSFKKTGKTDEIGKLAKCLGGLAPPGSGFSRTLKDRLCVISNQDFSWFAENALPVRMRNALDDKKKVKDGALWSEEYLPPDTLMTLLVGTRGDATEKVEIDAEEYSLSDAFDALLRKDRDYLQVGGNETVGHGWFHVRCYSQV